MSCPINMTGFGPSPIPEEAKWVQVKEIKQISGFSHGCGKCAPQQGTCKLTLNVKNGIIKEALVETIGCSGMTHSAAMASEILTGKTILEALLSKTLAKTSRAMWEQFIHEKILAHAISISQKDISPRKVLTRTAK